VLERGSPDFDALMPRFAPCPGARAIIRIDVERISDSCGYGVPLYEYRGERDLLGPWAERKGEDGLAGYRRDKNTRSIDGLPGVNPAEELSRRRS